MSWQEDLRRLDADLAAGRIEPAAHRKVRDELLAQASGVTVPSPVPAPLRRPSWHSANPASVVPSPAPAPPPPARVEAPGARPPKPAAPSPAGTPATSGVPSIPVHMTTAPSPADINPTRYLTMRGPGGTTVSRFPPIAPVPAPLVAGEPEGPGGRHRGNNPARSRPIWLFLSLSVLVVLALVAGFTMWPGSDKPGEQPGGPAASPVTGASGPLGVEGRLPKLPGMQNNANSTMSLDRAVELGVVAKPTAEVLRQDGATEVVFRGSAVADGSNLLMVAPMPGVANAEAAVEALYNTALANGFSSVPSDLRTAVATTGGTRVRATWYTSGGMVVTVGVSQTQTLGDEALAARMAEVLQDMRPVLPPG